MCRVLGIIILLLLVTARVEATSYPPPFTYTIESSDGRFVFVMRSTYPQMEDLVAPGYVSSGQLPYDHIARTKAIREKYPQSGLYRNDGSSLPLWVVNWHSRWVAVSSDGIHLIRYSMYGADTLSGEAFTFCEGGREIRKYRVGDLVSSSSEFKRGLFGSFRWLDSVNFNEERATFSVVLANDDRFLFDVKTGEVLEVQRNRKKLFMALSVGAAVLALIIGLVLVVRRY